VNTREGVRRLAGFADAVVAIAITLLVLPLADVASQSHGNVGDLLSDHVGQLGAFALSFVVIARLWIIHHRMFESVVGYDSVLVQLTMVWLFTVVFLPFPTELVANAEGRAVSALYIGTLLASAMALALTDWWLAAHPRLMEPNVEHELRDPAWVYPALLALALVVAVAVPTIGLWALLVLLLVGPLRRIVARVRSRKGG